TPGARPGGEARERLRPRVVAGAEHPAPARLVARHQDRERPGLLQPGDAGRAAAQRRGQGGEHRAGPVRLDAQRAPRGAVEPVLITPAVRARVHPPRIGQPSLPPNGSGRTPAVHPQVLLVAASWLTVAWGALWMEPGADTPHRWYTRRTL